MCINYFLPKIFFSDHDIEFHISGFCRNLQNELKKNSYFLCVFFGKNLKIFSHEHHIGKLVSRQIFFVIKLYKIFAVGMSFYRSRFFTLGVTTYFAKLSYLSAPKKAKKRYKLLIWFVYPLFTIIAQASLKQKVVRSYRVFQQRVHFLKWLACIVKK